MVMGGGHLAVCMIVCDRPFECDVRGSHICGGGGFGLASDD